MSVLNRRDFLHYAGILPVGMLTGNDIITPHNYRNIPESSEVVNLAAGSAMDPVVEVDLANIGHNIKQIRRFTNNRDIMAVVKCNAYGHGLVETAKYVEKQDVYGLAVGKLSEAAALRKSGVRKLILNFGPFSAEDAETVVKNEVSQAVYSDAVIALDRAAAKQGVRLPVHVNIDTGMGRVGVPFESAPEFLRNLAKLENLKIDGVFSTLTEHPEFDKEQVQRFTEICDNAEAEGIAVGKRHMASSAGVMNRPYAHLDMVRPGIAIYGQYPSDSEHMLRRIDLKQAMTLKTRASMVKDFAPGDTISYHRAHKANKPERIATLSMGYSDCYPVLAANKAWALVKGKRYPVIVDVTSNHSYVDVTGSSGVDAGEEIVLFGRQGNAELSAWELAKAAGTSVYKVIIPINPLIPRKYI